MGFHGISVGENPPSVQEVQETWFDPWIVKIPWRREWLPAPVFRPGEFHGLYSQWDHKELDMTKQFSLYTMPQSNWKIPMYHILQHIDV